ncbi:ribosomal protein L16, putative [Babesia bigemina]|uniref:Ribosomal protein L16, putative n=1 Tax=Babesia bigemina TaxID=5866 RepID=A0A061D907_BABBI|nr:ribosomal protein L16, putative [Babesia bigemina]CDR94215.1 ribosomal protein L16, putative [Babesia bigemina]|eukprot:XP_012766401.1 ribosomal protein L16, putative [Babesia bigemina]
MPPICNKAPLAVAHKVPKGRILPLFSPDVHLGKSLITLTPGRIKAESLEKLRFALKRILSKQKERSVNVHATYAVTRNPDGVKMGQGKGRIHHYVARVPAGSSILHLPQLRALGGIRAPLFGGFSRAVGNLPTACGFRSQQNNFEIDNLSIKTAIRLRNDVCAKRKLLKLRFESTH